MNETKISIIRKNPVFTSDKILKVFNYEVKDNYKKNKHKKHKIFYSPKDTKFYRYK